jgi:hypothetical protein
VEAGGFGFGDAAAECARAPEVSPDVAAFAAMGPEFAFDGMEAGVCATPESTTRRAKSPIMKTRAVLRASFDTQLVCICNQLAKTAPIASMICKFLALKMTTSIRAAILHARRAVWSIVEA